ncbi:hypothetical protein DFR28_102617 [Arenicella xantha]|uniref:Uncharacterized protein n=1 Tax=Arenicella xantha TaxID=644221 RepID=A0A395JNN2_9GAMM|nr:hypothetical protein DFR28_102617 [Arenicella xantha]
MDNFILHLDGDGDGDGDGHNLVLPAFFVGILFPPA